MDYAVIEQKEILYEAFAELLAGTDAIMAGISSEEGRRHMEILQTEIRTIWHDIMGQKYSTMDDIYELRGQHRFIRSYLEALENVGRMG